QPAMITLHGTELPPVRFDRETVILGRVTNSPKIKVRLLGSLSGEPQDYSWNLESEKLGGSTAFVLQAWKMAESTDVVVMPLAGRKLLLKSHAELQTHLNELADAGAVHLQRRNLQQADQFAQSLQMLDPNNDRARKILTLSNKLRIQPVKRQRLVALADPADEKPTPEATPAAEDKTAEEKADEKPADGAKPAAEDKPAADVGAVAPPVDDEGAAKTAPIPMPDGIPLDSADRSDPKRNSLLEELNARQQIRIQELTAEVNRVVDDSNTLAKTDFENALAMLKDLHDVVQAAVELPESIRLPLRRKLDRALQKLENDNEVNVQKAAALRTKQSQLESRKKLMDQAQRDEERMQQLIERVRALIIRGTKGEAEAFEEAEEYSRIAVELDPYNYVPNLDVFNSEAYGALDQARRMRALRADKFLATTYEVERAHVPYPDNIPILWPSAERWREITIKREKWKSVDVRSYSKQEEKIVLALGKPMKEKFDFVDATLEDVRNKLMEVYEINVIIDKVKLEEETIATDTADINMVISDITLKNALKLLLEPKNLTYVIQDEVLKITTKADGTLKKPILAYYAGDLVTPINPLFGQGGSGAGGRAGGGGQMNGGGMGGGGMGGMGGGMGGMGGGGMGGMGGGGMGMGGGVFNIPPMKMPAKPLKNGLQAQPEVQPKPARPEPAGEVLQSSVRYSGQAFAQIKDEGGALNGSSVKALKKKIANAL
ncbi:MAG: domain containing CoxE-like protein, partial [Planctomycetaceae bacterium]|nr:domain containing CoxE-like protein [Planctomycetaceae bacterium]